MKTNNISSPSPGWFLIEGTIPTSVMTESGHYVTGSSILLPVGVNQITPADLVAIAITAAGDCPAKPALVKALEALTGTGEPAGKIGRKRSPKEEAGQPSEEQVVYPMPPVERFLGILRDDTTEGGAE